VISRVVEVGVEVEGVKAPQQGAEVFGDPLGESDRHPAAETDDLDVRDASQALEQVAERLVAEQKGITAGENHVAHLPVPGNIVDAGGEVGTGAVHDGAADLPLAGAEAAVDGAGTGDQQQNAVGVAVHHPGHRGEVLFVQWIGQPRRVGQFPRIGDALPPDRVAGLADQAQVVRGDPHRIAPGHCRQGGCVDPEARSQRFRTG
jgi:hypothetical protein